MSEERMITKRNGDIAPLQLEKLHKVLKWASDGLDGVSVSQVEMQSQVQLYDYIKTEDLHETMIKAAADLITPETPDYQYMASRLALFQLRKKVYGQFQPIPLYDHVKKLVDDGWYDPKLLEWFTEDEFNQMDNMIVHDRDLDLTHVAMQQMIKKYLIRNRVTNEVYETPQVAFVLIAAVLMSNEDKDKRMSLINRFYNSLSTFQISLPTPIMAGVRTSTRQFSSCVKIDVDDSLDSFIASNGAIVKYISKRAGIGINGGRFRAKNSPIRNGEMYHTGLLPFYRHFHTAVKSCSQGGVRDGAATVFFPIWHKDVESLIVLKNNKGTDETRIRHLDYAVQINTYLYKRLLGGKDISLFSPDIDKELYESFFNDQEKFAKLYESYENNSAIKRKTIPAMTLFSSILRERANTGRIYIMNVDHCNTHSPFDEKVAPVYQSNLCMEITLPTKPLQSLSDEDAEVALCTLAGVNLGVIESTDDLKEPVELLVIALNNLLDYQDYPIIAAKNSTMNRRSLGIGVINYAYYLAKNGKRYSDGSGNEITHNVFEALQYFALKASNKLAKERGACPKFNETKYAKGILPIDTYSKSIDEYADFNYKYDWEALRKNIIKYGLLNSALTSLMPSETSSQISNGTNGVEPPMEALTIKSSKDGIFRQLVPDIKALQHVYEYRFDIKDNIPSIKLFAIMQKFIDQSISLNTNYNPEFFPDKKIPMQTFLKDMLAANKFGIKTLYYHNTDDGASDPQIKNNTNDSGKSAGPSCDSGACFL